MDRDDENHGFLSLEDMMDVETTEDLGSCCGAPATPGTSVVYILPSSSATEMSHSPLAQNAGTPPPEEQIDLNSSVSNLSWLHAVNVGSLQQQQRQAQLQQVPMLHQPENRNPNLLVNPTTAAPLVSAAAASAVVPSAGAPATVAAAPAATAAAVLPVSPVRVIEMTVPSGGLRIATGGVNYVAIPPSPRHQVYIAADRAAPGIHALSQQPRIVSVGGGGQTAAHGYIAAAAAAASAAAAARVTRIVENPYPKPSYSYSCLIALALKNSKNGCLPVSEIYGFMMAQFPYFKTAPDGWKNSVRHNLSLNKCFEKIENPNSEGNAARKGCLWALNPAKVKKMDDEIAKSNKKDPVQIRKCMAHPEAFESLAKGRSYRTGAEPRAGASVQAAVAAAVSAGLAAAAAAAAASHGGGTSTGAPPASSLLSGSPMARGGGGGSVSGGCSPPAQLVIRQPPRPPPQAPLLAIDNLGERELSLPIATGDDQHFKPGSCPVLDMDDAFLFEELADLDGPLLSGDSSFQRDVWEEVTSGLRISSDCSLDAALVPLKSPPRPSDHEQSSARMKSRMSCAAKAVADVAGGAGQCFRTYPLPAAV